MSQDATSNIRTTNNKRKHSSCLTVFLALAVVANSAFALMTWATVPDVLSSNQPIVIFAGALNLASAGFAIAVYKWKKWGVYGYVLVMGIIMLLNVALGDFFYVLRGIIPIGLLLYFARSSWKQMDSSNKESISVRKKSSRTEQAINPLSKIICPSCGNAGLPTDRFCRNCGNKLR